MAAVPEPVAPMLAVDGEVPSGGYGLEIKWDGFRCCVQVAPDGTTRLTSRLGNDITATYPELGGAFTDALGGRAGVLDGELVVVDERGHPDFGRMQIRHQRGPATALLRQYPVTFFAFDLLRLGSASLVREPYAERRDHLAGLEFADARRVVVPPHYTDAEITPAELLRVVADRHLEGIVGKRLDSPYQPGKRSGFWIKRALVRTHEVVIGGWQPGGGRRTDMIGSLLLGAHDERGDLRYIGHVGTGFTERALHDLLDRLRPLERPTSPFANPVPRDRVRDARWVEPRLVGEVVYRKFTGNSTTEERRLRHSAWRGLRPDKEPADVELPIS
ncbi:non-homologous end-joining DNA ligase [Amycolatopsis anabasis]|uniref:non-homologous end-joining DNA ligase n=1 Tax=Amycolatopsis anabasis TaxID=1840409 RepID=UPI00131A7E03|nr:non-homologous end-joining DNA ligase [Amycolatopsis anabasis]